MKRQWFFLAAACVAALCGLAGAQSGGDAILGEWTTEAEETIFHIYKEGDTYSGKIIWLREPVYPEGDPDAGQKKHDRKNPDKALRDTPILGYVILKNFKYDNGKWSGGTIYDPTEGKTYKCNMKLDGGTLNVRGYVGVALLGRTVEWHRPSAALKNTAETTGEKLQQ